MRAGVREIDPRACVLRPPWAEPRAVRAAGTFPASPLPFYRLVCLHSRSRIVPRLKRTRILDLVGRSHFASSHLCAHCLSEGCLVCFAAPRRACVRAFFTLAWCVVRRGAKALGQRYRASTTTTLLFWIVLNRIAGTSTSSERQLGRAKRDQRRRYWRHWRYSPPGDATLGRGLGLAHSPARAQGVKRSVRACRGRAGGRGAMPCVPVRVCVRARVCAWAGRRGAGAGLPACLAAWAGRGRECGSEIGPGGGPRGGWHGLLG